MEPNSIVLNVNGIEVIYNHVILVLKGVSLQVPNGKIVTILGGNGAGKTTTLRAVSNLLRGERGEVTKGSIELRGERIENLSPADLVQRGVVQVMEGRHCFAHLTIEENLMTGSYTRTDKGEIAANLEKVYNYFPRLKTRRTSQAAYTSGGEQQMCAIGRALMANPNMVLLDEPSMGLAPQASRHTRPTPTPTSHHATRCRQTQARPVRTTTSTTAPQAPTAPTPTTIAHAPGGPPARKCSSTPPDQDAGNAASAPQAP